MRQKTVSSIPSDAVVSAKARRARSGHLWIYRSDVTQRPQSESGSVVRVVDHRGRFVARAHYGKESEITLRIVSKDDVEITRDFWLARLRAGARWREQVVSDADAYRLVHAEGDLLPGLIIDRYGDCFALQTLTRGMDSLKAMWAELLVEEFHPRLIVERNDAKVRQLEGLPMTNSLLYPAVGQTGGLPGASQTADEGGKGELSARHTAGDDLFIIENGIKFRIDLFEGQKTGAFLDQRENRAAACATRAGAGLIVSAFTARSRSIWRKAANASTPLISEPAIERARQRRTQQRHKHRIRHGQRLRPAARLRRRRRTLRHDRTRPPGLRQEPRRGRGGAARLQGDQPARAAVVESRGVLITCSCSYHVGEELFLDMLAEAARDAGRAVQIVEKRAQSRDHPILLTVPETYYLKCIVARVMD